jgi:hypothetical protein
MNWTDFLDALLWAATWGAYDPARERRLHAERLERWEAFKSRFDSQSIESPIEKE